MKKIPLTKFLMLSVLACSLLLAMGCARKISFQSSSIVPAAQGTVKIKKDKNNNYHIDLDVKNMAEPGMLQPAKKAYIVWVETPENNAKKIGQIVSSSGFLSTKLKASFDAVSVGKPTKVFITAEDDESVYYPGMVVLTTDNF